MRKTVFAYAKTRVLISCVVNASYIDRTTDVLPKSELFKPLAIFCGCAARFLSDLVGNPEDRFSRNAAHKLHVSLQRVLCRVPTLKAYPLFINLIFVH